MNGERVKQTFRSFESLPGWGTADSPPTEFLLFPFGETTATKFGGQREVVYLTPQAAESIVSEWDRRKITGHFDYDHAILATNPEGTPSAGAFDLVVKPDGLWVSNVRWTPKMIQRFKDKEFQYYSPFFETEEGEDGKQYVSAIYNVAITNWPATDKQKPLITLSATTPTPNRKPEPKQETKRAHNGKSFNMDPKVQDAIRAVLEKAGHKEGELAQLILDIQAALSGAGAPPDMPAEDMEIAASAKALTGKSKAGDVKGVLQAAFDAKANANDLAKRVNALELEKAEGMIKAAKLTPSQASWCQSQLKAHNGFEIVKSYLETTAKDAPVGPHADQIKPPTAEAATPAPADTSEPTKACVEWCQKKGLDAKIYLKNWRLINPNKNWVPELA
jgi:phage I-like protein